jgi:hypothetical protein
MSDESRRLLKVFGVTVTDFEAEAEKLSRAAEQLSASSSAADALALLKDSTELCRELNGRWMEITRHVFAAQDNLLATIATAASRSKS